MNTSTPTPNDKVFLVQSDEGKRVVRARGPKAALDHVVANKFTVRQLSAGEALDLISEGVKVEEVVAEPQPVVETDQQPTDAGIDGVANNG